MSLTTAAQYMWLLLHLTAIAQLIKALPTLTAENKNAQKPVNILLILADDLGFGDTSVAPFTGTGILTPELEKMAARGTVMTNFHSAAATCTPTRASILTGLYPWRMGIKAVYEYGKKGQSNRDDWLPQLPTGAMVFGDKQYHTGHSGKWHLGGMRKDDLDMRLLPEAKGLSTKGARRCPHPGPNQQGFVDYVSVLDGPGSPRQRELQVKSLLHTHGCGYLLRNDSDIPDDNEPRLRILSDCEAQHAVRMMKDSVAANKPFYIHLWFHAPHGPWQEIPGIASRFYNEPKPSLPKAQSCQKNRTARYCIDARTRSIFDRALEGSFRYKTMVTAMDRSIGFVLRSLKELGLEENTLVVFTSDNGPEDIAGKGETGTAGNLKGWKRYLYEGGVRVPTIWQWIGKIPGGRVIDSFGVSTDLLPTFFDAADIRPPKNMRLDGMSLLPLLLAGNEPRTPTPSHSSSTQPNSTEALLLPTATDSDARKSSAVVVKGTSRSLMFEVAPEELHGGNLASQHNGLHLKGEGTQEVHPVHRVLSSAAAAMKIAPALLTEKQTITDPGNNSKRRTATRSAGRSSGKSKQTVTSVPNPSSSSTASSSSASVDERLRALADRIVMWHGDYEGPRASALWIYDFKIMLNQTDHPTEMYDLLDDREETNNLLNPFDGMSLQELLTVLPASIDAFTKKAEYSTGAVSLNTSIAVPATIHFSPLLLREHRKSSLLHRWILSKVYATLKDFASFGDEAHKIYLKLHQGRYYKPSPLSDLRFLPGHLQTRQGALQAARVRDELLHNGSCTTPCPCGIPRAVYLRSLPFENTPTEHHHINPQEVQCATVLLELQTKVA